MARRRFQKPTPYKRGEWWCIRVRRDDFKEGKRVRLRPEVRLAPAITGARAVQKLADEYLRPLNHGLVSIGSAKNFRTYVEDEYRSAVMPRMAKSTRVRYDGIIKNYLIPTFGAHSLGDITKSAVQTYVYGLDHKLSRESRDKIRDVLASILAAAVEHEYLLKNQASGVTVKREKKPHKPFITPDQFENILKGIAEPYASMVYVAIYTGLRVSELAGLRWEDVHADSITIDERYCRGDWGAPKSEASNATVPVNRDVIERIERLKNLSVTVNWGGQGAKKEIKVVRALGPNDLVFQSLKKGAPLRDNNILSRHIKPAGRLLGVPWVNWQVLRRSFATWLGHANVNVKDAQALMRHAHASTTQDIYQQFVPESQRRAVDRLSGIAGKWVN